MRSSALETTIQSDVIPNRLQTLGVSSILASKLTQKLVRIAIVLFALVNTHCFTPQSTNAAGPTPVPQLDTWKADLLKFGDMQCQYFQTGKYTGPLGSQSGYGDTYYDSTRVFYEMADYTGDSSWASCADTSNTQYMNTQVDYTGQNGYIAGWNNFSTGIRLHYQRVGDQKSKDTVHLLATHAWAGDSTNQGGTLDPSFGIGFEVAREVSYAILNHLDDEALGQPRRARLAELIGYTKGHFQQWFVTGYALAHPAPCGDFPGCQNGLQPFMVGLEMDALIRYYELTGDATIPPMIRQATDWLWANAWRPNAGGFYYDSALGTGDNSVYTGLNLLIAPAYAWMYKTTGETKYRDQGDQIFAQGVLRAHCQNDSLSGAGSCPPLQNGDGYYYIGKEFNQSYRWSPDYVSWRGSGQNLALSPPQNLRLSQ